MNTIQQVEARAEQLIAQEHAYEWEATKWDEQRALAQENGDLVEIAALCCAQLMCENGN